MVDGSDAKLNRFGGRRQEGSQDGVIGYIHEGHHGVPAFVVVPNLTDESRANSTYYTTFRLDNCSLDLQRVGSSISQRF